MFVIFVVGRGTVGKMEKKTLVTQRCKVGGLLLKKKVGCAGFERFFFRMFERCCSKAQGLAKNCYVPRVYSRCFRPIGVHGTGYLHGTPFV